MQSAENKVEPTSPNQPGKARPSPKEFGSKGNIRKDGSEM